MSGRNKAHNNNNKRDTTKCSIVIRDMSLSPFEQQQHELLTTRRRHQQHDSATTHNAVSNKEGTGLNTTSIMSRSKKDNSSETWRKMSSTFLSTITRGKGGNNSRRCHRQHGCCHRRSRQQHWLQASCFGMVSLCK